MSLDISQLQVGAYLMPNGGNIESAIRIVEKNEKGMRLRRCNCHYEGEEFFLSSDVMVKSSWVPVPIGSQLLLF